MGHNQGVLKIGVVYVKFEDGTEWSFPLRQEQRFVEVRDPEMESKVAPNLKNFIKECFPLLSDAKNKCKPGLAQAKKPNLLVRLLDLFATTAHAQGGGGWVFVCSPAPRGCVNQQTECTTWICGLEGPCSEQCCMLNLYTGPIECGPVG